MDANTWLKVSFWYWLAFTVNQNWKNKIYRLGKVDDRTPILQLARSMSKKQKNPIHESSKMVQGYTEGFLRS